MVGRDQQQIVGPKGVYDIWQRRIELLQGPRVPLCIVAMAIEHIKIHQIGEDQAGKRLLHKRQRLLDAHGIVGRLVLYCIDKGISLDDMKLEEYKAISPVFEDDIYDAISMKNCVERRNTIGAPGADAMQAVIEQNKKYLQEN